MHIGLTSLLRLIRPSNQTARKKAVSSNRRKLSAEALESRFALSTLVPLPDTLTPPLDPSALPAVVPTNPTGPTDPPPTNPPANPLSDPLSTNAPPVIHDFAFTMDGNWCTLQGWVSDDQNPAGDIVVFSGMASGLATVGTDSHFSYAFQILMPGFHGEIVAVTSDLMGLLSNQPSVDI